MRPAFILSLFVMFAACSETDAPASGDLPGMPQDCDADRHAAFIGQPADSLELDHAGPVRVLAPGSLMTMDYRTDRLNVRTDDAGIVTDFFCG
ncbi:I78 family peptidase inhibitor [Roseivivax sp. THAF197b]|uniref:I78 family peptidase inhibitor n=1 Tax=Roseivivax sp. THAF197b TaxID=2588299 RepID=UPI001268B1F3|nr:I78 family peptidase inhibitor [Roseivivax sp. THAF197b]QFS84048.1 Peptidase inhibitor I78 family protein [Roseivivax sp. THAF197b]